MLCFYAVVAFCLLLVFVYSFNYHVIIIVMKLYENKKRKNKFATEQQHCNSGHGNIQYVLTQVTENHDKRLLHFLISTIA